MARSKRLRGCDARVDYGRCSRSRGAGIRSRFEPYCEAWQRPLGLIGVVGVAWTLPQNSPASNCWSGVRPDSPRCNRCHWVRWRNPSRAGHRARHQAAVIAPIETQPRPRFPGLVLQMSGLIEQLVVVDAEYGSRPEQDGVAPIPLTCGPKKRAATLEKTMKAARPWKFGMLTRTA